MTSSTGRGAEASPAGDPSRGAALALVHARLLRDLLRQTDPADHDTFAQRFGELTAQLAEPLYRATLWYDRHRLAEIDADIAGTPYRPGDQRWLVSKALFAASLDDPDLARAYLAVSSFVATPDEVLAPPGVLDQVLALGMGAPQYPPTRAGPPRTAQRDRLKASSRLVTLGMTRLMPVIARMRTAAG